MSDEEPRTDKDPETVGGLTVILTEVRAANVALAMEIQRLENEPPSVYWAKRNGALIVANAEVEEALNARIRELEQEVSNLRGLLAVRDLGNAPPA